MKKTLVLIGIMLLVASSLIAAELKNDRFNVLNSWHFSALANYYEPEGFDMNEALITGSTRQPFDSLVKSSTYLKGILGYTFNNRWRVEAGGGKWTMDNQKLASTDGNVWFGMNYLVDDINDAVGADTLEEPFYNSAVPGTYKANNAFLEMEIFPIEVDLSYVFPNRNPKFKPYAGIGGGQYSVKADFYWRTIANAKLLQIRTDHNISCFNIHGGFDYFIRNNFAIRFDLKYVMNDGRLTIDSNDVTTDSTVAGINDTLLPAEVTTIVDRYNAIADTFDLGGVQVGLGLSYFFK